MRLAGLELANFRSWESLALRFGPGATGVVGPNASGKTSILEAAWYAASLGSHRTPADAVLVRSGEAAAVVRAAVERGGRTDLVELEIVTQGRARARLGGAPVGRRRDVLGTLRAAIFAPERVAVVRGDPAERRRFLDELLIQLHPRYHDVVREYERALRQRNALLREAEAGHAPAGIDAWDEALAATGGELCAGRAGAVAALAPGATAAFAAIGGTAGLSVGYASNVASPRPGAAAAEWTEAMRRRLRARRTDELVRGVTLVGPHRDDVEIAVGGLPGRTHASQGEAWIVALALVLGAHAATAAQVGERPVLLLDDGFSHLDTERRERLAAALPEDAQVLVTTSDVRELPGSLGARIMRVSGGGVHEDG